MQRSMVAAAAAAVLIASIGAGEGRARAAGLPSAPIRTFSLDVADVVGVEAAALQAVLVRQQRMTGCYVEAASPVGQPQPEGEMVLRVRWAGEAVEVLSRRQDPGLEGMAACLARFLVQDALGGLVGAEGAAIEATLRYRIQEEEGGGAPLGQVLSGGAGWSAQRAAVPLRAEVQVEVASAEGIPAVVVAELLAARQEAVTACYQQRLRRTGSVTAGRVVVEVQWERHLNTSRVLSETGGLELVADCLAEQLREVSALDQARSARRGASAQITFTLQAHPASPNP